MRCGHSCKKPEAMVRAYQRNCQAADTTVASSVEQVWQSLGADESDDTVSGEFFNGIWQHSRYKTAAAQRAGLTDHRWSWQEILSFPTII